MKEVEKRRKTAKLWISYMRMIALSRSFERSVKMGDIKGQLKILAQMFPYFYSTGHYHYAKCTCVYIQQMSELMTESVLKFRKITSKMDKIVEEEQIDSG